MGMNEQTAPYKAAADKAAAAFGTHLAIAKALGYDDLRNVSAWATGLRPFPPQHCVTLERESNGAVTRQDLRPDDWMKIWPELAPTADARGASHA